MRIAIPCNKKEQTHNVRIQLIDRMLITSINISNTQLHNTNSELQLLHSNKEKVLDNAFKAGPL